MRSKLEVECPTRALIAQEGRRLMLESDLPHDLASELIVKKFSTGLG